MYFRVISCCLALLCVSACAGSLPSREADPEYVLGDDLGPLGSNGLPYADGILVLSDVEDKGFNVKFVRFVRDHDTGTTTVMITDETAALAPDFTKGTTRSMGLTIGEDVLIFEDGTASLANGQSATSYLNTLLAHSGTAGIYSYDKYQSGDFEGPVDMEGFFAFGFETDPAEIAALTGNVRYTGTYLGYGQWLDDGGAVTDDEVETTGAITFIANFDADTVSGRLEGQFDPGPDGQDYLMVFYNAAIEGNGFAGAPDMVCDANVSCSSATSLGGAFFGVDGAELSGVIGFDETMDPNGSSPEVQFVGAAGFSADIDEGGY